MQIDQTSQSTSMPGKELINRYKKYIMIEQDRDKILVSWFMSGCKH